MKSYYFFLVAILTGCKEPQHIHVPNRVVNDTLATAAVPEPRIDTTARISDAFRINGVLARWEHFFNVYHYSETDIGLDINMKLFDHKTQDILLEYEFSPKYSNEYDYTSPHYFDTINRKHFTDLNFDGYKDFYIYSHGSMPMTSLTNIALYNNKTKRFEYSEVLTDNTIATIDTLNRILITESFDWERTYERRHHFDNDGNLKFTEVFATDVHNDSVYYQKLKNGKIIETRISILPAE